MTTSTEASIHSRDMSQHVDLLVPPVGGRFAALIFDMGTTLLEFDNVPWPDMYRLCVEEVHRRLIRLGHRPPEMAEFWERFSALLDRRRKRIREESREFSIGPLLRQLVSVDGVRLRQGELSNLCNAYYAPIRRAVTVYPEARPVLANLNAAGYRLGLLSNTPFRALDHREELQRFGLWRYFDATLFTSTLGYRKPHPEPFRKIARRLGVNLKRCLYIGDRQREDVLGAQNVGMTAVLVRRPHRTYEPGMTDSAEIHSLSELTDLLSS